MNEPYPGYFAGEEPPDLGCELPPEGWWCSIEPGHEGPCAARPKAAYLDHVDLRLDRGTARGIVEALERAARTPGQEYPGRVLGVAKQLQDLLGEPRPYPRLPR